MSVEIPTFGPSANRVLIPSTSRRMPWTLPRLADGTVYDPNNMLVSPLVQAANGEITAILKASPGAIDFTDPGGAIFVSWKMRDILGQVVEIANATDLQPTYGVKVFEGSTVPGLSDDMWIGAGVANAADLNTGTVDARGGAIIYSGGASRNVRRLYILNGADVSGDDASAEPLSRGFYTTASASQGGYISGHTFGITADGTVLATAYVTDGSQLKVLSVGANLHFWLCFGRTANTATQVTGSVTPWNFAMPVMSGGNAA